MKNFKEVVKGILVTVLIALGSICAGYGCYCGSLWLRNSYVTIPFGEVNLLWCAIFFLSLLLVAVTTLVMTIWILVSIELVYSKNKKKITN